jgi:hypothetical protein
MMRVKPAIPGAMVRDPVTKMPLPADGAEVQENSFWIRRLRDGDVVRVDNASSTDAVPTGREPTLPLTTR